MIIYKQFFIIIECILFDILKVKDTDMDIQKIKEDLSICYLKAISAVNYISLDEQGHDEDSTDVIIKKKIELSGCPFFSEVSVQLKATSSLSQYSEDDSEIVYALKAKNYNDLCTASNIPKVLFLLVLPDNDEEWVNWTDSELMIKGRMYWFSLYGKTPTSNTSTVSLHIPKDNKLSPSSIEELITRAAEEGHL